MKSTEGRAATIAAWIAALVAVIGLAAAWLASARAGVESDAETRKVVADFRGDNGPDKIPLTPGSLRNQAAPGARPRILLWEDVAEMLGEEQVVKQSVLDDRIDVISQQSSDQANQQLQALQGLEDFSRRTSEQIKLLSSRLEKLEGRQQDPLKPAVKSYTIVIGIRGTSGPYGGTLQPPITYSGTLFATIRSPNGSELGTESRTASFSSGSAVSVVSGWMIELGELESPPGLLAIDVQFDGSFSANENHAGSMKASFSADVGAREELLGGGEYSTNTSGKGGFGFSWAIDSTIRSF